MATNPLASGIDLLGSAVSSGNLAAFQEMIREFNLNYANSVAQLYGQNFGPGQPAPIGASTLGAAQQFGSIGYIPGFTSPDVGQTMAELSGAAATAQNAGQLTGLYQAPRQSEYSPGTFVRLDPNTYDYGKYGDQISYVTPSGQLQRMNTNQARAMGWNGDLGQLAVLPASKAQMLELAPPQNLPQQTLQGLSTYSNLNTAAANQALQQSQVTGMYQAPAQVLPPGTNYGGGKFSDLPQGVQQAYFYSNGGDWQAAMNKWVADSNNAIRQATEAAGGTWNPTAPGGPGGPGMPQETLQAQNQYFTQAQNLATQFGQYYQPGMPGQAGQAGVNMPQAGQQTQSMQEQTYRQQLDAINAAASLQANPFRQQQVLGQLGPLLSGIGGVAGFSSPNTVQGVGTQGGTGPNTGLAYMQQIIDDIRNPGANQASMQGVLNAIPTPNKINSQDFLRSAPSTQNMVLQGMQEKYGLDPKDSLQQIKNTLPSFQAPATFGTIKG